MGWFNSLDKLNLIDGFTYYLILALVVGTVLRFRNYRVILGVIFTFSDRWPKLLVLAKQHRAVFLRWPTLLPIGLTLALMLGNALASQFVWSEAQIAFEDLWGRWWALLAVTVTGGLMVFLDGKAIFGSGRFDRAALEETLDKAEHWLESWHAPALRNSQLGPDQSPQDREYPSSGSPRQSQSDRQWTDVAMGPSDWDPCGVRPCVMDDVGDSPARTDLKV